MFRSRTAVRLPTMGSVPDSGGVYPSRRFYVDVTRQLPAGYAVTGTPEIRSVEGSLVIEDVGRNLLEIVDGTKIIPANSAILFRVRTTKRLEQDVRLEINYEAANETNTNREAAEIILPVRYFSNSG